ncbi:hypothetical protein B0H16DRAFT_1717163 [Mycena metata]|uniref:Uncharacterized protein n=1 Tax=Mycena metata TaxID=1033252 RepID=A0AAD7JNL7_9AGAR|nr:hypothetical protein B0H16DRAFT_1717163 [Mycena metata]
MSKLKLTDKEVLDRRAEAAWRYRQRHKEEVNSKARLRMQKWVHTINAGPLRSSFDTNDVQLKHRVRAAQYRRNYNVRTKKASKPEQLAQTAPAIKPSSLAPKSKPKGSKTSLKPTQPHRAVNESRKQVTDSPKAADRPSSSLRPTKSVAKPRPRVAGSPSPKSLAAIAAGSSDEDSDDEAERSEESRSDGEAWTNPQQGGRLPALSFAVLQTSRPGYVPQRGQQPFICNGVKYWY